MSGRCVLLLLGCADCWQRPLPALGQAQTGPPPYRTVRHDEDYTYLADPRRRTDWLDPIKHIPLGRPGWYLSLGGELRERFELFENTDWKPAPADGFLLQKYMLSADLSQPLPSGSLNEAHER